MTYGMPSVAYRAEAELELMGTVTLIALNTIAYQAAKGALRSLSPVSATKPPLGAFFLATCGRYQQVGRGRKRSIDTQVFNIRVKRSATFPALLNSSMEGTFCGLLPYWK